MGPWSSRGAMLAHMGIAVRPSCQAGDVPHRQPRVELEQEGDGRWLAELIELPRVLAYGAPTRHFDHDMSRRWNSYLTTCELADRRGRRASGIWVQHEVVDALAAAATVLVQAPT